MLRAIGVRTRSVNGKSSESTGLTRVATLKMLPARAWECAGKLAHTWIFATVYAISSTGKVIMTTKAMAQ